MTRLELLEIAKPIPFNDEMVRAIQNHNKTVTRCKVKPQPPKEANGIYEQMDNGNFQMKVAPYEGIYDYEIIPPYQVGDYLYVRETWGIYEQSYMDANYILYRADFPNGAKTFGADGVSCDLPTWRPSTRMPKEAARIFLRVTDVRVERLQDITEDGVCEEGAEPLIQCPNERTIYYPDGGMEACYNTSCCKSCYFDKPYSELFGKLVWNSTVKKSDLDKYGWDANPWVWVIEFEKVEVTE